MRRSEEEGMRKKQLKVELGHEIKQIRTLGNNGGISLRKLAEAVDIPVSNMKYIEDGVNAPSPETYEAIIRVLAPDDSQRARLDHLYSAIRGTPPPDVCRIMCANEGLAEVVREIGSQTLSGQQLDAIKQLLISFKVED